MLSVGRFPWQRNALLQPHEPSSRRCQLSLHLNSPVPGYLNFRNSLTKSRSGLRCNAFKSKKNGPSAKGVPDEIDQDFDDELVSLEDADSEGNESDDDVFIPLENMKKWEKNKPRGFGEGKLYDTSIEDQLMKEIEQSRKAQLLNVNNLKNKTINPVSINGGTTNQLKGSADIDGGFQVRLMNLPKKMNIHRDLQVAFNGIPGILSIVPVVSGNKKTKDPICRGLAFINFKHQDQAHSFVQNFSGKSIVFGKIERRIKCELISPTSPKDASAPFVTEELEVEDSFEAYSSLQDSWDESPSTELDDVHLWAITAGDEEEINEDTTIFDSSLPEELEVGAETSLSSDSSEKEANRGVDKKAASKRKKGKTRPRNNTLGAANRLKTREKAMLTGVLSKYGGISAADVRVLGNEQISAS